MDDQNIFISALWAYVILKFLKASWRITFPSTFSDQSPPQLIAWCGLFFFKQWTWTCACTLSSNYKLAFWHIVTRCRQSDNQHVVIKSLPSSKGQVPDGFLTEFWKSFKEEVTTIISKLLINWNTREFCEPLFLLNQRHFDSKTKDTTWRTLMPGHLPKSWRTSSETTSKLS